MRCPLAATIVLGALALAAASGAHAAVTITVDKTSQQLTVDVDGEPRHRWPVSTGRLGYATPSGSFRAFRMEEDHFSREWDDAPMPHSIFFTPRGHAIHGYLDTRRIGWPASAGCIRLEPQNARTLFALVKEHGVLNTRVVIHGDERIAARRPFPAERLARRAPGDVRTSPGAALRGDAGAAAAPLPPVQEIARAPMPLTPGDDAASAAQDDLQQVYPQAGYAQPGYGQSDERYPPQSYPQRQPGYAQGDERYPPQSYPQPGYRTPRAIPGYAERDYAQQDYRAPRYVAPYRRYPAPPAVYDPRYRYYDPRYDDPAYAPAYRRPRVVYPPYYWSYE
jgi:hypothetical protein